jgi:hypothetical protein
MCPACLAATIFTVVKVVSAGGLATAVIAKVRGKQEIRKEK